uniref:Protein kinase (cAMP-dependent, catalytic) inhibitor gamma n=1 Tax=Nothobranchius furzeri TaxID=105023 RepID=A0A8C6PFA8_NOTFU
MMDVETSYSDFINCDRTGRRNAVPDITGEESDVTSRSEITKELAEMNLQGAGQWRLPAAVDAQHQVTEMELRKTPSLLNSFTAIDD